MCIVNKRLHDDSLSNNFHWSYLGQIVQLLIWWNDK